MPFKIIQSHRCRYQSKARMRLSIGANTDILSLYRVEVIADYC